MLLKEFSTIFDRPEKVKKLREYILSLAVRGKLVEQDENDEPASVLLERIREEKDRLIKEKKIKNEKPLPEISEDEISYELPKGWEWVRFGEVCKLYNGYAFKSKDYIENGIPIIRISDVYSEITDLSNCMRVSEELYDERYIIKKGDFLIAMSGGTTGKYGIYNCDEIALQNQRVGNIKTIYSELVYDDYKNYFIIANRTKILNLAYGGAQPNISNSIIDNLEFSLPPINEQKRIVKKLDYLMEFCDKLEEQLEKQVKYGSLSAKSVLNGVSNCNSYDELEEALRFIIKNFKDLTLADGAVSELKNAILSLAVKGKLVLQDDSDESAKLLLERIREEKDRLLKEKKIKKENELPELNKDEIPYELPKGWGLYRLNDIALKIVDGTHHSPKSFDKGDYMYITAKNIKSNGIDISNITYINEDIHNSIYSRCNVEQGDILLIKDGATTGTVTINQLDVQFSLLSSVALIKTFNCISNDYLVYSIRSPFVVSQIQEMMYGSAITRLTIKKIKDIIIPLPPLNEQKRIVEKVDKLMKVCDELELRIEESKNYNEKLMESILKASFKV